MRLKVVVLAAAVQTMMRGPYPVRVHNLRPETVSFPLTNAMGLVDSHSSQPAAKARVFPPLCKAAARAIADDI